MMTPAAQLVRALVCAMILVAGSGPAASAEDDENDQVVRDTFVAGTTGNAAIFRVVNHTGSRITGVKMTPSFPLQWIALTGIVPESADLEPGETAEFEIQFKIFNDAPDGATETVTLFFNANEDIEIRNPQFNLVVDITREADEAHFVISVEGEGYATYFDWDAEPRTVDPDGTVWVGKSGAFVGWKVAGLHDMWMTLKADEDHDRAKESLRRYILSGICKTPFMNGGAASDPSSWGQTGGPRSWVPIVWQRGPRIVTVAGPFETREAYTEELRRTWKGIEKKRPDGSYVFMSDLAEKVRGLDDCGGNCCAVKCEDHFHCE